MKYFEMFEPLHAIEGVAFLVGWILLTLSNFSEFNGFHTLMFFEPEMTVGLIAMSILTGFWIGGTYERYYQCSKMEREKKVAKRGDGE